MRGKHGRQQASILGHLEALKCLKEYPSEETVYAEFGAGKGMYSIGIILKRSTMTHHFFR